VSEQILNGTSAQSGYTAPITLVHAGKYRTENKLKIQAIHKQKTTQNISNNAKHSKTKLASFSRLVRHSARKWGGLILQRSGLSKQYKAQYTEVYAHNTRQPRCTIPWALCICGSNSVKSLSKVVNYHN